MRMIFFPAIEPEARAVIYESCRGLWDCYAIALEASTVLARNNCKLFEKTGGFSNPSECPTANSKQVQPIKAQLEFAAAPVAITSPAV
jgi:hypothetical protein